MKKHLYIILLSMIPWLAGAQINRYYLWNGQLAMGADTSEIYLCTRWYPTGYDSVFESILHSTDNGCSFAIKNSRYIKYPEILYGKLFSDPTPGVVYKLPVDYPDSFAVSFDTGMTLLGRSFSTPEPASGCIPGELYFRSAAGLFHSVDYGLTFETWPTPTPAGLLQDVGANPGELYFSGPVGDSMVTVYSTVDYGTTIQSHPIRVNCQPTFYDIRRGTSPGEFYLLLWDDLGEEYFYIYHATGYGDTATFQRKFECGTFTTSFSKTAYSAGRKSGTFYVTRRSLYFPDLYVDYSTDYGLTFTTCYHYLDSTYTGMAPVVSGREVSIFPNPATDRVTVEANPGQEVQEVTLWDHRGTMCSDIDISGGGSRVTIATGALPRGLYLVRVALKDGTVVVKKVVLE